MRRLLIALLLVAGPAHSKKPDMSPVQGTGFTCNSADGKVKRLNIDLKRGMYQSDDRGPTQLAAISDGKILIIGQNPDLVEGGPMGPMFFSEELDRRSLMLTDFILVPDKNINKRTDYQCVMGDPLDFTAGRQF